jgi:hypothetical protein
VTNVLWPGQVTGFRLAWQMSRYEQSTPVLPNDGELQPDEMDKVVDSHKTMQCGANETACFVDGRVVITGQQNARSNIGRCKPGKW